MTSVSLDPRPRSFSGGSRCHIARPDHPLGTALTDIGFCGIVRSPTAPPPTGLKPCKRCESAWEAYRARLRVRSRADTDQEG